MKQRFTKNHILITLLIVCCLLTAKITFAQSPGGVSTDLKLWLKADAGTNTIIDTNPVTTWVDQASNLSFTSTPTNGGSTDPVYKANSVNYNPSVLYTSLAMHSIPKFTGPSLQNSSVFVVGQPGAKGPDGYNAIWTTFTNVAGDKIWAPYLGNNILEVYDIPIAESFSNLTWHADEVSFIRQRVSGSDVIYSKQGSAEETLSNALSSYATSGTSNFYTLGNNPDPTGIEPFGNILETFIYQTSSLSTADVQKIESYMGLKYGITLDNSAGGTAGNYVLPTGTVTWDANANPAYHHNVIGIVRDDASNLVQKQSKQSDDVTRIYLSTLTTTNADNAGAFSNNNQAVVLGNNNGKLLSTGSTEYPAGLGIISRIDREWKITNTNFNGTFSLDIKLDSSPITASDLKILIDDDGDFTNATLYSPTITYQGGIVTISGLSASEIPTNSTRYLTIVSQSPNTPLPVTLVEFNVSATENNQVLLNWKTELELNNDFFTVERSTNGVSWEIVSKISGAGNSFSLKTYRSVDENPYSGVSYYRLKQTDVNGGYVYSNILSVKIKKSETVRVAIYPNPTTSQLTIEGDVTELKTIKVYDLLGRDVSAIISKIEENNEHTVFDLSRLPTGVYTVKTANTVHKLVKQ